MSSNRPETSVPDVSSSSKSLSGFTNEKSIPVLAGENYVPRANDLVTAASRIPQATNLDIPLSLMHSEAVDSSLLLGQGASFTVTRQAVPLGRTTMIDCYDLGKLITLKLPYKIPRRPQYVVYKSPRIEFQADGKPMTSQDRRALRSVLTEIHALVHPPIAANDNIINILGIAWGSNYANPLHRLPVLVVEYGDRGTLADVQLNQPPLSNELKLQIALGIANGLQTLHDEGIVHGDLKPENIIMFSDEDKILIPKLADFGFAVVEEALDSDITLGGTRTWRAPESYAFLKVTELAPTDVYSFGLVAWSIAIDGQDPFNVLISEQDPPEKRYLILDRLKAEGKLQDLSKFENWITRWRSLLIKRPALNHGGEGLAKEGLPSSEVDAAVVDASDRHLKNDDCKSWREQVFFNVLEDALSSTLSLQPEKRHLSTAIHFLIEGMDTALATEQLADINLSSTSAAVRQSFTLELRSARDEEPIHPYSETPDDDPVTNADILSPWMIGIRLHEGKSATELDPPLPSGLPVYTFNASEKAEGVPGQDAKPSCVLFQMSYTVIEDGTTVETSQAIAYQIAEGMGIGYKIPRRMKRLPVKISKHSAEGATTWLFTFDRSNAQQKANLEVEKTAYVHEVNGVDVMRRHYSPKKAYWASLGYHSEKLSWQRIRNLDPDIQRFIVGTLSPRSNANAAFTLSANYLNGYGVSVDIDAGLHHLVRSALEAGFEAQAYVYRLHKACGRQIPAKLPITRLLQHAAVHGSRMALQDLTEVDTTTADEIRVKLRNYFGGVGAPWYQNGQWLLDLTSDKLRQDDFDIDALGTCTELPTLRVNDRGDHILHAAAANGANKLVIKLLEHVRIDVNQLNAHGETALLCATRSGHSHVVKTLLSHGASASIQASTGETPLHWLVSFYEEQVPDIGRDLVDTGGAVVDACTNQNVSHSVFPSTIDVDYQIPGTPLSWAVRENRSDIVAFLLTAGANAQIHSAALRASPLMWAAQMHHTTCLQLIISHLEKNLENVENPRFDHLFYSSLIWMAIQGADRFSMILRNGDNYLTQLESTLKLLQEKMKSQYFFLTQDQELPLGYAVSGAHDEAAELILKLGWSVEGINRPNSSNGRTPLLHAVHWNRRHVVLMLLKHGANSRVKGLNPFDQARRDWSALHIFAEQGHNDDLALVSDLLASGVPVDGQDGPSDNSDVETPLYVAIRKNAFNLADALLSNGANINALSTRSSLIVSSYPLTGLGHTISLNARHCIPSLRYLLSPHPDVTTDTVNFVVEPTRRLSALHLCAMVPNGLRYTSGDELSPMDFDYETNRRIVHELLDWFPDQKHLEYRCSIEGRTALHLAAEYGNVEVVVELVKAGALIDARDEQGQNAAEIARCMHGENEKVLKAMLVWLQEVN